MPVETGGGNYPPSEEEVLREKVYKSWDAWHDEELVDELHHCFPDEGKDFWAVNNLTLAIVKDHEFFVVNTGKNHNVSYPDYVWGQVISAPNLKTVEQKKAYSDGIVNGLSWLKDAPPLLQRYALDPLDSMYRPIVRTLPLWDDKNKPLNRQNRILLNFSGWTTSLHERRGAHNEHSVVLRLNNPDRNALNATGENNLRLMRALPFSFRNAANIVNPNVAQKFFDFRTGNGHTEMEVINFIHNFAQKVVPLPDPITEQKGQSDVKGQDFADYIAKVRGVKFLDWQRKGFENKIERLIPSNR